jgi:hypothetical protein
MPWEHILESLLVFQVATCEIPAVVGKIGSSEKRPKLRQLLLESDDTLCAFDMKYQAALNLTSPEAINCSIGWGHQ